MKRKAFGTYEIAKICDVTPSTVGNWIEKGLIPNDMKLIGGIVEDISYNNAKKYFGF